MDSVSIRKILAPIGLLLIMMGSVIYVVPIENRTYTTFIPREYGRKNILVLTTTTFSLSTGSDYVVYSEPIAVTGSAFVRFVSFAVDSKRGVLIVNLIPDSGFKSSSDYIIHFDKEGDDYSEYTLGYFEGGWKSTSGEELGQCVFGSGPYDLRSVDYYIEEDILSASIPITYFRYSVDNFYFWVVAHSYMIKGLTDVSDTLKATPQVSYTETYTLTETLENVYSTEAYTIMTTTISSNYYQKAPLSSAPVISPILSIFGILILVIAISSTRFSRAPATSPTPNQKLFEGTHA